MSHFHFPPQDNSCKYPDLMNTVPENQDHNRRRLRRATLAEKIKVLDWHNNSERKCQQATLQYFHDLGEFAITKSTMNRWVLNEKELRQDYKNLTLNNNKVYKTKPKFKDPEVNRCLELLYDQITNENCTITERELIQRWSNFYLMFYNIPKTDFNSSTIPTKSNGWLHHFKRRTAFKRDLVKRFHTDSELYSVRTLEDEKLRLKNTLARYQLSQIYQLDEVSFKINPTCFIPNHQSNSLTIPDPAERVTVALCVNATGSSVFAPLIVSDLEPSNKIMKSLKNLFYSKSGLLTTEIFFKYLKSVNDTIAQNAPQEKIVILLDDLYTHIVPQDEFTNIELVYFAPSLNKLDYYPLDFGVIRIFKTEVKYSIMQIFFKKLTIGMDQSFSKTFTLSKEDLISVIMDTWNTMKYNTMLTSTSFHNSQLIPSFAVLNQHRSMPFDSDVSFSLRDTNKETQIVNMLRVIQERNLFRNHKGLPSRKHSDLYIDHFLFPAEEKVENVHLQDSDIIELVRREHTGIDPDLESGQASSSSIQHNISQIGQPESAAQTTLHPTGSNESRYLHNGYPQDQPTHPTQRQHNTNIVPSPLTTNLIMGELDNLKSQRTAPHSAMLANSNDVSMNKSSANGETVEATEIGKLMLGRLKDFFSLPENINHYSNSAIQFHRFLNTYLQESNDLYMKSYANQKINKQSRGYNSSQNLEQPSKRRQLEGTTNSFDQFMG
ncbi:BA75_02028T0 [Komagataella pastoris]|uniref:BA75_02028T0 n=1 Tax=Komagataella pastoris TaxID=4922 RepID=A0A1B2JC14_PICPA|nr:BA75_02028T0 [Komagataella pastoris]